MLQFARSQTLHGDDAGVAKFGLTDFGEGDSECTGRRVATQGQNLRSGAPTGVRVRSDLGVEDVGCKHFELARFDGSS
ncbi:MAG TPA: hypothetical protein VGJ63_21470 [Micromonosporaceae bacterium]